ncbi:hypothetical protein GCM10027447_19060 [Glycomyces halotolerans]
MTAAPPPDWSRVPGAGRAHILDTDAPADPERPPKRPSRIKSLLAKPLVWVLGLLLAAIAAFLGDYLTQFLGDRVREATTDPVFVYDVQQIDPPTRDLAGYVVPGSHTDLDAVSWGENGTATDGGAPDPAWVQENGGAAAGWGAWEVVLETKRDTMITIVDIRAQNIECTEPAGGTHFIFATQGEGEPTNLGISIDRPAPEFKILPEDWYLLSDSDPDAAMASFASYGDGANITLEPGEQHVIRFYAHAAERSCTWQVALEYAADGQYRTAVLEPNDEHRFALAALLPVGEYETVVIPFTYCEDYLGRAVTGAEAAEIVAARNASGGTVDCT